MTIPPIHESPNSPLASPCLLSFAPPQRLRLVLSGGRDHFPGPPKLFHRRPTPLFLVFRRFFGKLFCPNCFTRFQFPRRGTSTATSLSYGSSLETLPFRSQPSLWDDRDPFFKFIEFTPKDRRKDFYVRCYSPPFFPRVPLLSPPFLGYSLVTRGMFLPVEQSRRDAGQ